MLTSKKGLVYNLDYHTIPTSMSRDKLCLVYTLDCSINI